MRLINADALCKELDQMYSDGKSRIDIHRTRNERDIFYANAVKDVIRKVNSAPTVMQWVDVDNEKPKHNTCVLVTNGSYIEMSRYMYGRFYLYESDETHCRVTHWTPLLPPPVKQNTFTSE